MQKMHLSAWFVENQVATHSFATCLHTATKMHPTKYMPEISFMPDTSKASLETILVVDDDPGVLRVVVRILRSANFRVLLSDNGANAIELTKETEGKIDLLLSDINMPLMSGPDLGEALKKSRPGMHVMLMSGGTDGSLLVLNYGWAFIQKPFVATKLVEMVTNVLHSPDRSQLGGQEFDSRKDTAWRPPPHRHSASRS